ncbi:VOC family protein [Gandjariella thermophila]|uniref:Glyoxalase n=1 Tax=Gandjariella thermophila TaxID=1931992 RepID=A0A4D4JD07_9PSEU|nr:VOC family protein [Gandjariella thermophila]GDY32259.1 glyoxalase [Gandjariella thermophila]
MVTRDSAWPGGVPCWVDLGVDDLDRARAFYGELLGWEAPPGSPETGGYSICLKNGRAVAGIGPKQGPPDVPPAWTTYLSVADADETARKISAAGGKLLVEPGDVMDAGRLAIAADPGGAVFGIWQSRAHTGIGLANEPGALCWNENMSRDYEANLAFYRSVFGYDYDDMSANGFRYSVFKVDGNPAGGIGELGADFPADIPPHWMAYFAVADTDAAVAKVTELGGGVLRTPWDTPYGRMAILGDSQGAVFAVIAMPAGG